MTPNRQFTMVGFSLMKVSSCSQIVRPPNTSTKKPPTIGMIGQRPSIQR